MIVQRNVVSHSHALKQDLARAGQVKVIILHEVHHFVVRTLFEGDVKSRISPGTGSVADVSAHDVWV
jgi:hypothetical protein